MAGLAYPLDGYQLTPRQQAEHDYLVLRLERECMKRFGFDYLPGLTDDTGHATAVTAELASRRYGVTDVAAARQRGYRLSTGVLGQAEPQSVTSIPEPELAVLSGRAPGAPPGGCVREATQSLGSVMAGEQDAEQVADLGHDAFLGARSDPRVRAVSVAWSQCMASGGYHYSDPYQAAGDPLWNTPEPTALERTVATTDITCKLRTNLIGVSFAVEAGYQKREIGRHTALLERVRRRLATRTARLTELLGRYRQRVAS